MARDLKLAMVAEGRETHEQMLKIKALGVKRSGVLLYRPMPAADILLNRGQVLVLKFVHNYMAHSHNT